MRLRAASLSAGQLVSGASVKFRGVAVGNVESVTVLPSGEAVMIEMSVRPDLAIPAEAAVLVAPESFFGDWQAEIITRRASTGCTRFWNTRKRECSRGSRCPTSPG